MRRFTPDKMMDWCMAGIFVVAVAAFVVKWIVGLFKL